MPKVEAVVFDVDGTILDSREYITRAFLHSLAHHGIIDTDPSSIAAVCGLPLDECYERLAPGVDKKSLRAIHREFHQANLELLSAYTGALETLQALGQKGLKLAVFTSHGPAAVDNIKRFELDYFDTYVHAETVTNYKPHPEGFLLACEHLAVRPERSLMVGDAVADIEAGKRGGALAAVGITHGFGQRADLEAAGADFIVDDLNSVLGVVERLEGVSGES